MKLRVFGTAGVRGVFNDSQDIRQIYNIAETVAFTFGKGRYCIGWDGRKSSYVLADAVSSAVMAVGSDAVIFGLIPTPVVAYGTRLEKSRGGFAVTASHNPQEFSGMKMFDAEGMEMSEEDETKVERVLAVNSWKASRTFGLRKERGDVLFDYKKELLSKFSPVVRSLKILVDCGNGPGAFVTPEVLGKLGHQVIPLNGQVSWRFPARPPEPTAENLRDTAKLVLALKADLAFVHDGDADRLVMINSAGEVVPDSIVSILAMWGLGIDSRAVILSENTSSVVEEEAGNLGCRVIRSKVGKTFTRIRGENAAFATEPSKIVDPEWGMWEDGMYASILIADLLVRNRRAMSLLTSGTDWYYKQINLRRGINMNNLEQKVEERLSMFRIVEERHVDGLKLVFRDGSWIMFRASGTEAITRIYCEAKDLGRLQELIQEGVRCVESLGVASR